MPLTFLSGIAVGIAIGCLLSFITIVVWQLYKSHVLHLLARLWRFLEIEVLGWLLHKIFYRRYRDSLVKELNQVNIPGEAAGEKLHNVYMPMKLYKYQRERPALNRKVITRLLQRHNAT